MKSFLTISFVFFLKILTIPAHAADVFCSQLPIVAPNPADPVCSVITDRGLTGTVEEVLAALGSDTGDTCKRDTMSGYEIRQSVDATEYNGLDSTQRANFLRLTSGGESLAPYGFGEIAIAQIFGAGPTLTALGESRVLSISLNALYGLNPRAIDVQLCQGG